MTTLGKILVPVDLSPCSESALKYAILLGRYSEHPIEVLYVAEAEFESAKERLEAFLDTIPNPNGIVLLPLVRKGNPYVAITLSVGMRGSDLVVMGSHGWSEQWHIRLGEVAENVATHATCAVLTVATADLPGQTIVSPWLPRPTGASEHFDLTFEPRIGEEILATLVAHCPRTGASITALDCLGCHRFVAGCLSPSEGEFDYICRKDPSSTSARSLLPMRNDGA